MAQRHALLENCPVYTVSESETVYSPGLYLVEAIGENIIVTLPPATAHRAAVIRVKLVAGPYSVTIAAPDLIDGKAQVDFHAVAQGMSFYSDGTTWHIL